MTQAEFNSEKYSPKAFSMPFAASDTNTMDIAQEQVSIDTVNIQTGIPAAFSSPGNYIERTAVNGIFNAISRDGFFNQTGGYRTFDKNVSDVIGGYPKGAVLKYFYMGILYDVMSLVDNNEFNFIENGIDNIHWIYVSSGTSSIPDWSKKTILESIPLSMLSMSTQAIGTTHTMPFDGYLKMNSFGVSGGTPFYRASITINSQILVFAGRGIPVDTSLGDAALEIAIIVAPPGTDESEINITNTNQASIGTLFGMLSGGASINTSEQPIPVSKGCVIKIFGHQTFTQEYFLNSEESNMNGTLSGTAELAAYPMINYGE